MCTPGGVKERRADNRRTNDRAPRLRKAALYSIYYYIYLHYRSYTFASPIMFRRQYFFSSADLTWFQRDSTFTYVQSEIIYYFVKKIINNRVKPSEIEFMCVYVHCALYNTPIHMYASIICV